MAGGDSIGPSVNEPRESNCALIRRLEKAERDLCTRNYQNALVNYQLADLITFYEKDLSKFRIDIGLLISECIQDEDWLNLRPGLEKIYNKYVRCGAE